MEDIRSQVKAAAEALCREAALQAGSIVVVGCSTSEIVGQRIGSASSAQIGEAVFQGLQEVFQKKGIYLAAQCCEHLNRAIVIERSAPGVGEIVNAIPRPGAGGAFAGAAYQGFKDAVLVEEIKADAGLDIGGTLIGMHLKKVAVPLRLEITRIGEATLQAARTRPKFIGGVRAIYDEKLL